MPPLDLLERAYRGLGSRYLPVLLAIDLLAAGVIATGAVAVVALYEHMSAGQLALVAGVQLVMIGVAAGLGMRRVVTVIEPLRGWAREPRRGSPAAAWQCAVDLPIALIRGAGLVPFVAGSVPGLICMAVVIRADFVGIVVLAGIASMTFAYAVTLHIFAAELALRPVVRDISRHLAPRSAGRVIGLSLRTKLLITLPLINMFGGVAVAALIPGHRAGVAQLGVAMLISAGVAATITFVLTAVVGGSIVGSVGELTRAARRVRSGDLSIGVAISSTDELGVLGDAFNEMQADLGERVMLRRALQTYAHPAVADRVIDEGIVLPGHEVDATMMFVDIRGFTRIAADLSPGDAVDYVNGFLTEVLPVIVANGGHVDKYTGDGFLAVFGAPESMPEHATAAVRAACDIVAIAAGGSPWRVGIGMSSGPVLAGTIGAHGRHEFTVIGDAVNVASRVEALAKRMAEPMLLTESTRQRLAAGTFELRSRGSHVIRGAAGPIELFAAALRGDPDASASQ